MATTPSDPAGPQGIRRRELLLGTLAAGFAVGVRPISAATITTDAGGLTAGFVSIPVEGGTIPAYRARPATGTNLAVVLVVQEIFGVHAHIQDVCRRLARLGYLAIAPSLFERQGDVTKLPDIASILPVVAKVPDAQVMSDLDATVAWAGRAGGGDSGKLGITGFCWGGRITWLYAAHNPSLKCLRKNRLRSRVFSSLELTMLRSDWFSANQRLRTSDCRRSALFGLPDRGHLTTPLGNHLFMPSPSPA